MLVCTDLGIIDEWEGFDSRDFTCSINSRCCCACPAPNLKSKLAWMEGFRTERMNRPFCVVRQYNGGDLEFGGSTRDAPYAQFRTRLLEKSGKFVPPFGRHEMFKLTFAIVHQILVASPGIESCRLYTKRYFNGLF
jgi:hypothetical protein